mmetsp:Transcript_29876/g.59413  ORF Transcript_29876/g.59413 Transcript_29876/m.59413 type:complete len:394 (+) Transcript_29876:270-1451(+)
MPSSCLILGGTGFIGRNLVHALLSSPSPPALIKVVDIKHPAMQHMGEGFGRDFADERVVFQQCDLSRSASVLRAFEVPPKFAPANPTWSLIVNLAAETASGSSASVYEARCTRLSGLCAEQASKAEGDPFYVEVSTARVYASNPRKAADEGSQTGPQTVQAGYKLEGDKRVMGVEGLKACILRPAIVYGIGDRKGLMSRAVCAATYVNTGEVMKFLWDGALRMNTVHVEDVCGAVLHAGENREKFEGKVYNLADAGDSDQQRVNGCLGEVFGVEVGFFGKLISNVARINMDGVVEVANDKHLQPWGKLCAENNVDTVLSPFIHRELLENNHVHVDGSAISRETGFAYRHTELTSEPLREMVLDAIQNGIFPNVLDGGGGDGEEKEKDESKSSP